ncbi:hypothetical protein IE53DRAFT_150512 [Violaceomyces palustris]|uniref:Uncharacterized protein n=1 Tax=Violaceomyces palustris TaxID=1673888 RepID=A0ACD0NU60_9BASI|nr:hypothetical protein IE53DRAFT_150512 [Violaceomyces palustris]
MRGITDSCVSSLEEEERQTPPATLNSNHKRHNSDLIPSSEAGQASSRPPTSKRPRPIATENSDSRLSIDHNLSDASGGSGSSPSSFSPSSSSSSDPISQELALLKKGLQRLESHLANRGTDRDPASDATAEQVKVTARWSSEIYREVMDVLPPPSDFRSLITYLFQEAHWLIPVVNAEALRATWTQASSVERLTPEDGVTICMSLAAAALLLSENGHVDYKLESQPQPLYDRLVTRALRLYHHPSFKSAPTGPRMFVSTLITNIYKYGPERDDIYPVYVESIEEAERLNFFNEMHLDWLHLSEEEKELRRKVSWELILMDCWTSFYLKFPRKLKGLDINVGIPSYEPAPLRSVRSHASARTVARHPYEYPLIREIPRTDFPKLGVYLSYFIPEVAKSIEETRDLIASGHAPRRQEAMSICNKTWTKLKDFETLLEERFDLRERTVEELEAGDKVLHRKAAQALLLHCGIRHMESVILRPWLAESVDDRSQLRQEFREGCLRLARKTVATIPPIKVVLSKGLVPFFGSWVAVNLFNAATTLAIPIVKVCYNGDGARTAQALGEIRGVPAQSLGHDVSKGPGSPSTLSSLPDLKKVYNHGYGDTLRSSTDSNHDQPIPQADFERSTAEILMVLDMLSVLEKNPLAKIAKSLLSNLVEIHGFGKNREKTSSTSPSNLSLDTNSKLLRESANRGTNQYFSNFLPASQNLSQIVSTVTANVAGSAPTIQGCNRPIQDQVGPTPQQFIPQTTNITNFNSTLETCIERQGSGPVAHPVAVGGSGSYVGSKNGNFGAPRSFDSRTPATLNHNLTLDDEGWLDAFISIDSNFWKELMESGSSGGYPDGNEMPATAPQPGSTIATAVNSESGEVPGVQIA